MTDRPLKPCPFCGCDLVPNGDNMQHPDADCVLSQMVVFAQGHEAWNARSETRKEATLEAALSEILMAFDDHVALPDPACSCHLNPPCGDCETNAHAREARDSAVALLAVSRAALEKRHCERSLNATEVRALEIENDDR